MFKDLLRKFKNNNYVYIVESCLYDYASLTRPSLDLCPLCRESKRVIVSGLVSDLKRITNEEKLNLYQNSNKNKLALILMSDDIVKSINDNIDTLIDIIPEIKDIIGFEHNHPHHHLDVWNHTLLALSLSESNFDIRLSLLLHDIGKPHSYQDDEIRHFNGHTHKSCEISRNILNRLDYDKDYVAEICYLIENYDNFLTRQEIEMNYEISLKRFLIQYCDSFAHNPKKLEKRIRYLKSVIELFKQYKPKIEESVKTKVKYNIN